MRITRMKIRNYQPEDTDALISVWRSASALAHAFLTESFLTQEAQNMRNLYLPNAETWVVEREGKPVGFIALIENEIGEDEIGGLFLSPSLHGQGLGRAMVDHAVALKGPLKVEVFEKNAIGRRFYDRYGFIETGRYAFEPARETMVQMTMPTT